MVPFETPTAFLTIAGLFGLYQGDIADRGYRSVDDFVEWLRRHDHDELAETILDHPRVAKSLEGLLAEDGETVRANLSALDKIAASVAAHVEGFAELSIAVRIDSRLSDQSVSILRQLNEMSASALIEYPLFGRAAPRYVMFGGMGGDLRVRDVRFIEEDIRTLVELGLLVEEAFNGHRGFRITRAGAAIGGEPALLVDGSPAPLALNAETSKRVPR